MFALLVFTLVLWPQFGFPTPVPARSNTSDTIETSGWRPEPATRGTFRLLFSCLTTLTTCVYTAVHLNVPKKGTTNLSRYKRKAAWVVLGIIAPEFVVYTAWAQWYSARKLLTDFNNIMTEKMNTHSASGHQFELEPWTMTHAFYATMGGFVIDTKPTDGKEYIRGCPRLTVTPRGMHFLALNGIIPPISKGAIKDKSKANAFAKIFTCVQVPSAGGGVIRPVDSIDDNTELGGLLFDRNFATDHGEIIMSSYRDELNTDDPIPSRQSTTTVVVPNLDDNRIILLPNQLLKNTGFSLNPRAFRFFKKKMEGSLPKVIELELIDVRRWEMASEVLRSKPFLLDEKHFKARNQDGFYSFWTWKFKELVCDRAEDWPGKGLVGREVTLLRLGQRFDLNRLMLFLPLATAAYGALHAAAWNSHFPTTFERYFWQYSSIAVAASGSVFISSLMLLHLGIPYRKVKKFKALYFVIRYCFGVVLWAVILIVLPIAFVVSRVFLVIESFVSLRRLPVSVYDTPRWLQDIPHI